MEKVITAIHQTIQKSLLKDFQSYIAIHSQQKKFCIYSDYCLDSKKYNKVASFTVAPAWTAFPEYENYAINAIPRDIKKTKSIAISATEFLKNRSFFHFNFVINDNYSIARREQTIQDITITSINEIIRMIEGWLINQPEGTEKFSEQIKKFKQWKQELRKKSINTKLFKHIAMISALAGYIAFLITKEAEATDIVWFSDRDVIVNSYGNISYDLFDMWHFGLCDKYGAYEPYSSIGFPDTDGSASSLWYDHLVRIPDYLAGALSSWKMDINIVEKPKHAEILRNVFADNPFCSIIEINISNSSFRASRLTVSPT